MATDPPERESPASDAPPGGPLKRDLSVTDLPASTALAWGLREEPTRGPKRALTLQQIVDAGVGIATAEGLAAVSMGRIAREVGVSTMALYRYVERKDELLELMVDSALGPPPEELVGGGALGPPPEELPVSRDPAADGATSWRPAMRRWAYAVRDAYRANPWAIRVPIKGPPIGPNNIRWLEAALGTMRDTALPPGQRISMVIAMTAYVRAMVMLESDIVAGMMDGKPAAQDYAALLRVLTDQQHFPEIAELLASGAFEEDDEPDDDFNFGVDRLLDGVAALIRAQRRNSPV